MELHTQPGDIVLDPFAGHGSTLVAARNLGRNYLACELDPKFADHARRAVADAGLPLFAAIEE